MRFGFGLIPLLMVTLAAPAAAGDARGAKKPRLDLRASPRMALMPVDVLVVAELVGGDEIEDFYCPAIEWEWGDGGRSAHEADCPPFVPGMAMDRRHSARHAYRQPGEYSVRVTLRRVGRALAVASTVVTIGGTSAP
jgi:hypothetical protein